VCRGTESTALGATQTKKPSPRDAEKRQQQFLKRRRFSVGSFEPLQIDGLEDDASVRQRANFTARFRKQLGPRR
jgi:hypothetical protein